MGRLCPVCHKGPYRPKALKEHIKRNHPSYYQQYIQNGPRVGNIEERKKRREQKKKKERR